MPQLGGLPSRSGGACGAFCVILSLDCPTFFLATIYSMGCFFLPLGTDRPTEAEVALGRRWDWLQLADFVLNVAQVDGTRRTNWKAVTSDASSSSSPFLEELL